MKCAVLLVVLVGVLGFALPVEACEECRTLPGGRKSCWSGVPEGWQWCYGGFGRPCSGDGYCRDCSQINCEPQATVDFCDNPVAGCAAGLEEVRPSGFTLSITDSIVEPSEAVADERLGESR
jgi:hypothetical protein